MKNKIFNLFSKYLATLPYYLFATGIAFSIDVFIYVFTWPYLGTNLSTVLGFSFGVCVLYSVLRLTRKAKFQKKRKGLFVQLVIGIISLIINLLILNTIDWIYFDLLGGFAKNSMQFYYPLISKFIASSIGFFASSNLTMKFNFNLLEKR